MDTLLLLHICVVSLRELVPMPFGASKNLRSSVLYLQVFIRIAILVVIVRALFCFRHLALRAPSNTPKVFPEDVLDKCKKY